MRNFLLVHTLYIIMYVRNHRDVERMIQPANVQDYIDLDYVYAGWPARVIRDGT